MAASQLLDLYEIYFMIDWIDRVDLTQLLIHEVAKAEFSTKLRLASA